MKTHHWIGMVAVVTALALAGCTPAPPASPPPSPVVETTDPSVEPTPTPEPEEARADYGFTYFYEADLGTWDEMSAQLHHPVAGMPECPYYGRIWETEVAITLAFMDPDGICDRCTVLLHDA